ncbi:hypothetical protein [Nocardioides sambongensis]|uniref:hypothetical protein n=1 Tax=Nocardioides sambongensis TaxID=2589074 RepID=UPI00112EEBCF|nr:hypothetical protein [Nocardioides sambongensis]
MPHPAGRITDPVPRALERVLRHAVLAHVRSESRRSYPQGLVVGFPTSPVEQRRLELSATGWDHSLRTEVVQAMAAPFLAEGRVPLVWLTRPYVCDGHDDLAWASAVGSAAGELGADLGFVVVTRRSWRDPRTGVGRTWQRAIRRR